MKSICVVFQSFSFSVLQDWQQYQIVSLVKNYFSIKTNKYNKYVKKYTI